MMKPPPITTLGAVTFGPCGEDNIDLFRVNPNVPLRQALEQVSARSIRELPWERSL